MSVLLTRRLLCLMISRYLNRAPQTPTRSRKDLLGELQESQT